MQGRVSWVVSASLGMRELGSGDVGSGEYLSVQDTVLKPWMRHRDWAGRFDALEGQASIGRGGSASRRFTCWYRALLWELCGESGVKLGTGNEGHGL